MFPQRKLSEELAQSAAAAASASSASASGLLRPTAKRKLEPPAERVGDAEEADPDSIRSRVDAANHLELDPVIVITATTECLDKTLAAGDPDLAAGLDALQGCYFSTLVELNGGAIFKSTDPCSSGKSIYIFRSKDGWYGADQVFTCEKDKNKLARAGSEVVVLMWAQGDAIPRKIHYPFWSSKAEPGLTVRPLWEFSLDLATEKAELEETVAGLYAGMQEVLDAGTVEEPEEGADDKDKGKGDKGKSKGKNQGKNRSDLKSRGGWMPKMASLAAAVCNKDWGYAKRLVDRYCSESETLNTLVTSKLEQSWAAAEE